jgi:hypothetical protein
MTNNMFKLNFIPLSYSFFLCVWSFITNSRNPRAPRDKEMGKMFSANRD